MLFSKPKRIRLNVMMDSDIIDALDAFAMMNKTNRSHVLNELLRPSLPALNELLDLAYRMKQQNDEQKNTQTLKTLNQIESQLTKPLKQIPDYIKGLQQ